MTRDEFHVLGIMRWQPDETSLANDVARLGDLLHECVHDGAAVNFILPFSREDAAAFWRDRIFPTVKAGTCRVLLAYRDRELVGTVQIDLATPPNQPHRGEIKKLLVHPSARRGGIARELMLAIEDEARLAGRTLLTLDTASPAAERLYASLGYVRVGVIPRFSLRPDSRELEGTTVMYKELTP
ncbi:MAG TPA: GNAT family N-acetyltransferase [Pyrinomonadaceae bacterium]|nr:GNAT family N-acetyltransferase [Pyrinomonadaceae bacterium]